MYNGKYNGGFHAYNSSCVYRFPHRLPLQDWVLLLGVHMTDRYFVSDDTEHKCCYDVCIKDRQQPYPYREGDFYTICECKDLATAVLIVEVLNRSVQ